MTEHDDLAEAREAECVELRAKMAHVVAIVQVGAYPDSERRAVFNALTAALSRAPGGTEALRKMLKESVTLTWDEFSRQIGESLANGSLPPRDGETVTLDVDGDAIVARVLDALAEGERP